MTIIRTLATVGALLFLSAGSLSAQATKVTCKDGSKSAGGQGACSSHGGIAVAMSTAKAAKADGKALKAASTSGAKGVTAAAKSELEDKDPKGAIAQCKDKTYSHAKSRQGACAAHGGVGKFLGAK